MTTDAVGGIWTYALELGAALRGRGHLVTLAVLGPPTDAAQTAEARAHGLTLAALKGAPEWLAADRAAVRLAGRSLARLAQRAGADLIHLNHPALAAETAFGQPVVAVNHSCVATWWEAVRGGPLLEDFRWRAALVERGLAAAAVKIAPTHAFAEQTRRVYGFAGPPSVVANGRTAPAATAADAFGRAPAPFVFTAGRLWDEGKNVATLDRAAPRLPVTLVAAGPLVGPNGATVTLRHCRVLGPLDGNATRERLAERPVYATVATYEPFGLTVLEAAQAGCALVLSDIPTFRELWDGAALFVPPHDEGRIAEAITRVLGEPALREQLARAALDRAGTYTVERQAEGTARAYVAAFAATRPPAPTMAVA